MSEAFQRHGAFSWCELMTTDVDAAIPNVGRFCTFQDPQGAVISAITYRMT
jgi:hypothetical protein